MSSRFALDRDIKLTPMVISQCAGAHIDLYTIWVVIVIGQEFKLSIRGQRNINNALGNLPVHIATDDRLSFGWTLKHAIRNRGVHEGGYEHVALEAAMSETFPEAYASKVLYEMASAIAVETDIIPHFSQIHNMVRSSSGAFSATEFPVLVEDYVRMCPFFTPKDMLEDVSSVPCPTSLAWALKRMGEVTSDSTKQMSVVGGPTLGWVAAFAEWIFDLHIAIYSETGDRLHVNHDDKKSQILLVYAQKPGISSDIESWDEDAVKAKEVVTQCRPDLGSIHVMPFGGRVMWNSLLPRVFGRTFYHLDHEETRTFGTAMGAAARALQELGEEKDLKNFSSTQEKASPLSYGTGLVQTFANWLPELRHMQGRMERQLKLSFQEARHTYHEQIRNLVKICGCDICSFPDPTSGTPGPKPPRDGYCLTVLVETTIALGLSLSRITVSGSTYPTRHGIQSLYLTQAAKKKEAKQYDMSDTRHFKLVYGNDWNALDCTRLQTCAEIFSGSRPTEDMPNNLVALSHQGICVYLVKLDKSEGASGPNTDGLIRVVSGGICVQQKIFVRACLGPVAEAGAFENVWEKVSFTHLSQPLYCK